MTQTQTATSPNPSKTPPTTPTRTGPMRARLRALLHGRIRGGMSGGIGGGIRGGIREGRDECGALTPAVAVMAVGLMLLGGLVTDGGRQLNARSRAQATAEEAARAGADMLDLRQKDAVIDPAQATDAVSRYCDVARSEDDSISACEVSDLGYDRATKTDYVEVHVEITVKPLLFGLIGMGDMHANETARASAVQAVTDPYNDRNFADFEPDYPPITVSLPNGTDAPSPTTIPVPTQYTTMLCGDPTTLALTVGVSCSATTITTHNPSPPPPRTTQTETTYTTFPTTVTPDF